MTLYLVGKCHWLSSSERKPSPGGLGHLWYGTALQPWGSSSRDLLLLCPGPAFKLWFLLLVFAWAMLQVCLCPVLYLPDVDSDPDLPHRCRCAWQPGQLAEPGNHHWTCPVCLAWILWDCTFVTEGTALPALLWLGTPASLSLTKQPVLLPLEIVFLFVDACIECAKSAKEKYPAGGNFKCMHCKVYFSFSV